MNQYMSVEPRASSKAGKIIALASVAVVAVCCVFLFVNSQSTTETVSFQEAPVESWVYDLFTHWMQKNERLYGSADEKNYRLQIFRDNVMKIKKNRQENKSYKLAINKFADLTAEEFKAKYISLKVPTNEIRNVANLSVGDLPAEVDWTTKGAVAPVKDQAQCGSCWAFSTIAAVEGLQAIKAGTVQTYSEQQLVDCSKGEGNEGCNGGWMDWGFEYIRKNGLESEADYKYTARDGKCKADATKYKFHIGGYTDVAQDEDQLQAAVAQGVVSVAIEADTQVFQFYESGVITGADCGIQLDHGVAVVGYGVEDGNAFWKVRNSWGPAWGDAGYVKIGRTPGGKTEGVCGIAQKASFPTA